MNIQNVCVKHKTDYHKVRIVHTTDVSFSSSGVLYYKYNNNNPDCPVHGHYGQFGQYY